jgi:hypothetical protein
MSRQPWNRIKAERPLRSGIVVLLLAAGLLAVLSHGCAYSPSGPGEPYVPVMGPPVPDDPVPEVQLPAQAFLDRSLSPESGYTEDELDQIAACDLAVFDMRTILTENGAATVAELRSRNPDIIVLGLLTVLSYMDAWVGGNQRSRFPMSGELYDLLAPHTVHTTDGELVYAWEGMPMITPWSEPGGFDVSLLNAQLDLIATHANRYPGTLDGVFHDYLSPKPFPYPSRSSYSGEVDLDGDGIGWDEDPGELNAWIGWQHELARQFQERFGPGFIQVGNGGLPRRDAVMASLLAGANYEQYPGVRLGLTVREGIDLMLENHRPGYFTPRRGRTWSIMFNHDGVTDESIFRVSSLLTGQFYARSDGFGFPGLDPVQLHPGSPLGPVARTEFPDGSVTFSRPFENGDAVVETYPSGSDKDVGFISP